MRFSFKETFEALSLLTDALPDITGVDIWRRPTNKPNLADITPKLQSECVTPPSKLSGIFTGDKNSVWYTVHFELLRSPLQKLGERAEVSELQNYMLDHDHALQAFGAFAALKNHVEQHHEWKDHLPEILNNLPDEPYDLDTTLRLFFDGELETPPKNHIIGRLLQAYYIQTNERYRLNGAPRRIGPYLHNSKGLFDRTKTYVMNRLRSCPLPLNSNGQIPPEISATDMLKTYSWFACPTVVEMVLPNLQGAAAQAAISLSVFLETLYQETGIDLTEFEADEITMRSLNMDEERLWRFEKMDIMLCALGHGKAANALAVINDKIWTNEQRKKIWDNQQGIELPGNVLSDVITHAQTMHL